MPSSQKTVDIDTRASGRHGDTLGYARVSTPDRCPSAQRNRLLEAGAIRVFTNTTSGNRSDGPGLAELINHARPGDRLCVTRLDRLGRSLRELLETVDGLKARGNHLVSLEESLDTSSAAGELVFHVFGAIAHFERRLISERTRDGIAEARRRGRQSGRPPLDPETVSAAQKLIDAGLSPAQAAKQLSIGRATAYRIATAMRDVQSSPLMFLRTNLPMTPVSIDSVKEFRLSPMRRRLRKARRGACEASLANGFPATTLPGRGKATGVGMSPVAELWNAVKGKPAQGSTRASPAEFRYRLRIRAMRR